MRADDRRHHRVLIRRTNLYQPNRFTQHSSQQDAVAERLVAFDIDCTCGISADYDRKHCVDLAQLVAFLQATQPEVASVFSLDADNPTRRIFLARLRREVDKRGVIEVLRSGLKHGAHNLELFMLLLRLKMKK